TVLGGQAQNIVVQNDATARKAITWLKKTNRGRATFLPIESLRPRYITKGILSKLVQHPGYLGIAADVVSTKEEYQVVRSEERRVGKECRYRGGREPGDKRGGKKRVEAEREG